MSKLLERSVLWLTRTRAFESWLRWMAARGSLRLIYRTEDDADYVRYLDRYYIFRLEWRGRGLFAFFLHRFWASDQDGVHDHPWPNASFVLTGGYHEEGADGVKRWHGPGAVKLRGAELQHRLTIDPAQRGQVWTLFAHGPKWRRWGFVRDGQWRAAMDSDHPPLIEGIFLPRIIGNNVDSSKVVDNASEG